MTLQDIDLSSLGYAPGTILDQDGITTRYRLTQHGALADVITRPWSEEGQTLEPKASVENRKAPVQLMVVRSGVTGNDIHGSNRYRSLCQPLEDHSTADRRYRARPYRWIVDGYDAPEFQATAVRSWIEMLQAHRRLRRFGDFEVRLNELMARGELNPDDEPNALAELFGISDRNEIMRLWALHTRWI